MLRPEAVDKGVRVSMWWVPAGHFPLGGTNLPEKCSTAPRSWAGLGMGYGGKTVATAFKDTV